MIIGETATRTILTVKEIIMKGGNRDIHNIGQIEILRDTDLVMTITTVTGDSDHADFGT